VSPQYHPKKNLSWSSGQEPAVLSHSWPLSPVASSNSFRLCDRDYKAKFLVLAFLV